MRWRTRDSEVGAMDLDANLGVETSGADLGAVDLGVEVRNINGSHSFLADAAFFISFFTVFFFLSTTTILKYHQIGPLKLVFDPLVFCGKVSSDSFFCHRFGLYEIYVKDF
jgi:hypothetical protein